jgi:hypothetical protein
MLCKKITTATGAVLFLATYTQPFFRLPEEDEFDFLLLTLLPPVAPQVLPFALANAKIPAPFDVSAFVTALLASIEQDELPVKLTKSKIAGIFATSIGSSLDARQDAARSGAGRWRFS